MKKAPLRPLTYWDEALGRYIEPEDQAWRIEAYREIANEGPMFVQREFICCGCSKRGKGMFQQQPIPQSYGPYIQVPNGWLLRQGGVIVCSLECAAKQTESDLRAESARHKAVQKEVK